MSAGTAAGKPVTTLPPDVAKRFIEPANSSPTRFFAAETDLNGDDVPELLVHLVGLYWCGTGGCTTYVFRFDGQRHHEIGRIPLSRPPIRRAASTNHGWHHLIVGVGGGGEPAGQVEWQFDASIYAPSPGRARHVDEAGLAGSQILIDRFQSWSEATLLDPPPAPATGAD